MDEIAVNRIFMAKGRPSDNPLILHIHDAAQLDDIVQHVPDSAKILIKTYWPGPLTLVFQKQSHIPRNVTAGLSTVAVRMPNSDIALELLRMVDLPLAAPSANRSGRPSSTKVEHVFEDLDGHVDAIIDGGSSVIGIESTVLDVTTDPPTLLRPGTITKQQIETVLGYPISTSQESHQPKSPGMKYKHYQPHATVYWRTGDVERIRQEAMTCKGTVSVIEQPHENEFYDLLRQQDNQNIAHVFIITNTPNQLSEGFVDRLQKASMNYKHR